MDKNVLIKKLVEENKNSFYLYDEKIIKEQIEKLKSNFPDFEFLYSIKTNPNKNIVKFIASNGIGADAASVNEVLKSIEAGIAKENIIFSTPGKTKEGIEAVYDKCIITADSYNELKLLDEIAKEKGVVLRVGMRINANYSMDGKAPVTSKYGIDEESLLGHKAFLDSLSNIKLCGIHVHLKSQILDYKVLAGYYEYIFNLAIFCVEELGFEMDYINFGGGIGVAYSERENELEIDLLGDKCRELIKKYKEKLNCRLIIESGRFLVCKSGTYVTYVVDKKVSRGVTYLIAQNGYNGFFKQALVEMLLAYTNVDKEELSGYEPLFTSYDASEVNILKDEVEEYEIVTIGGSLCTAADLLGKDLKLPKAEIGDVITVSNAGSYGFTLSPMLFSSHPVPDEIYLTVDDDILES